MDAAAIEALAQRFITAVETGDIDTARDCYAEDAVIWHNTDELEQNGYTVADVARYMMTFTQAQTAGGGIQPNPGQSSDVVMEAVFPSSIMPDLPCLPEARS